MKQGRNRVITFTTDFGTDDHYAAVMKGVALTINHRITCVDITHAITPQDITGGAFAIAAAYRWFPAGTIHVAVVDPGVGTDRRALAVQSGGHMFVGPDNGIFTPILNADPDAVVYAVTNKNYRLPEVSGTFHGRDVFAPAAAWLSKGIRPVRLGKPVKDPVLLDMPAPLIDKDRVTVTVLHVDRFGNVVTNLPYAQLPGAWAAAGTVTAGERAIPLVPVYAAVPAGTPLAIAGSSGYLELAVNSGSAAEMFSLKTGGRVELATG